MTTKEGETELAELVLLHRTESSPATRWDRFEQLAKIGSLVAIPVLLAVGGWYIQDALSRRSVNKDYVQLAVSILTESDEKVDPGLREWAVELLNENSPTKFEPTVAKRLSQGQLSLPLPASASPLTGEIPDFESILSLSERDPRRTLARAVARVDVLFGDKFTTCTGWLVSTDILITTDFCVRSRSMGETTRIRALFSYVSIQDEGVSFDVHPVPIEIDKEAGYALLRTNGQPGLAFGTLAWDMKPVLPGEALFVIHYAGGRPVQLSRTDCYAATQLGDDPGGFQYSCDTGAGVSGAPVFSSVRQKVVGIHYQGARRGGPSWRTAKRIAEIAAKSSVLDQLSTP